MLKQLIVIVAICLSLNTYAKADFKGIDFSGEYECTGNDDHEGKYTGKVTLELVPTQSFESYGAYKFTLEVPEYGTYLGQAAANDMQMAIHFALTDQTTKDYGTGIAVFSMNKKGKWVFHKYYYEPEYKSGNFGLEDCVQR